MKKILFLSLFLMVLTKDLANQIVGSNRPISKTASMLFRYILIARVAFHTCILWLTE